MANAAVLTPSNTDSIANFLFSSLAVFWVPVVF